MDRTGNQLLKEGKAALAEANGKKDEKSKKRDLLSLLLKANLSTDIPESQRMNDRDVLARKSLYFPHIGWNWTYSRGPNVPRRWPRNYQVYTILSQSWFCKLRRHDSNATTWALYSLSIHSDIQTKLRDELFTIQSDNPTMDELNSLSYLDSVVRETLRIHAPVAGTMRVAVKDDVVPLGTPFVDQKGRVCDNILWVLIVILVLWRLNMTEWLVNDLCYAECARGRHCIFQFCRSIGRRHYGGKMLGTLSMCIPCLDPNCWLVTTEIDQNVGSRLMRQRVLFQVYGATCWHSSVDRMRVLDIDSPS